MTTQCCRYRPAPFGACWAIRRQPATAASGTGERRSTRLRTARVVVNSSSPDNAVGTAISVVTAAR
jgi:hypothetical protein